MFWLLLVFPRLFILFSLFYINIIIIDGLQVRCGIVLDWKWALKWMWMCVAHHLHVIYPAKSILAKQNMKAMCVFIASTSVWWHAQHTLLFWEEMPRLTNDAWLMYRCVCPRVCVCMLWVIFGLFSAQPSVRMCVMCIGHPYSSFTYVEHT